MSVDSPLSNPLVAQLGVQLAYKYGVTRLTEARCMYKMRKALGHDTSDDNGICVL